MRRAIKIIAVLLILAGIGIALHQVIVYGGWEWDEAMSVYHHEGMAVCTTLLGLLLYLLSMAGRR